MRASPRVLRLGVISAGISSHFERRFFEAGMDLREDLLPDAPSHGKK
jgi:hypothetical protein